jgi:hypothetical protein
MKKDIFFEFERSSFSAMFEPDKKCYVNDIF